MRTLSLSPTEQQQLVLAQQALLAPLEHADACAWSSEIIRHVKLLVGGDMCGLVLPGDGSPVIHASDYGPSIREYPDRTRSLEQRLRFLARGVRLGVYNRELLYGPESPAYFRSAYYNEWVVPNRYFDAIGLAVRTHPRVALHTVAQLMVHHGREDGRRFGGREMVLLHLLLPSFRAGIEMLRALERDRQALARTLDTIREALLVCDVDGRVLHANASLVRLLSSDPDGGTLSAIMERQARLLAQHCCAPRSAGDTGLPRKAAEQEVRTATRAYRLRGSYATRGGLGLGRDAAILVAARRSTAELPSEADLADRYSLSRRQTQVALLVASGKSDPEIAQTLSISLSTARNHVAQVRVKLGVSSRTKVGPKLLFDADPP